ncbi:hypothetical protein ACFQ60_00045 [Streptomyces zhihengii]
MADVAVPAPQPTVPEAEPQPPEAAAFAFTTAAVPVAAIPFTRHEPAKLDRYLDITKSAMLFGTRVILVEGLAEALLMPAFARLVLDAIPDERARTRAKAVFRGSCIVAVDGVDFTLPAGPARWRERGTHRRPGGRHHRPGPHEKDDRAGRRGRRATLPDTAAEDRTETTETGFNRAAFLTKHLQDWDVPEDCFRISEQTHPRARTHAAREPGIAQGRLPRPAPQVGTPLEASRRRDYARRTSGRLRHPVHRRQQQTPQGRLRLPSRGALATRPDNFRVPEHLATAIRWIADVEGGRR